MSEFPELLNELLSLWICFSLKKNKNKNQKVVLVLYKGATKILKKWSLPLRRFLLGRKIKKVM